jgi:hypothetical protein
MFIQVILTCVFRIDRWCSNFCVRNRQVFSLYRLNEQRFSTFEWYLMVYTGFHFITPNVPMTTRRNHNKLTLVGCSLVSEKIFEISANQSILLALAAMLNIRLERKTETLFFWRRTPSDVNSSNGPWSRWIKKFWSGQASLRRSGSSGRRKNLQDSIS